MRFTWDQTEQPVREQLRAAEEGPAGTLAKNELEIKPDKAPHADVRTRPAVEGHDGLATNLDALANPHHPRIRRRHRLSSRSSIQGRLHVHLDQRNEAIEGRWKSVVAHGRLKIWKAVLDEESPVKKIGRGCAGRDDHPEKPGDGHRFERREDVW